ncbi:MAG: tyrosine-type recombinase/integrase [Bacteroidales bacterium]|nr:tyrosine-type recombinase/integrase [Bacteroidales bacterium]
MKYSYRYSLAKPNAKGYAPIRCRISFNRQRVDIRLGFSVNIKDWNQKTQTVKKNAKNTKINAAIINNAIAQMNLKIEQLFTKSLLFSNSYPTIQTIKDLNTKKKTSDKIASIFEKFLSENEHLEPSTVKIYTSTLNAILKHKGNVSIDEINENFMLDFEKKLALKVKNSTIKTFTDRLKTVLRWADKKNFFNFKILNYKQKLKLISKPVIYLEKDELFKLLNAKTETQTENDIRNMYCFCAFTGLRFSDMKKLKWSDVNKDFIDIVTLKTSDRLKIELNEYSKSILEGYKNKISEYVFPQYSISLTEKILKKVCYDLNFSRPINITYYQGNQRKSLVKPKYDFITTHTARKTFVVNSIRLGIPLEIIMRWTGHKTLTAIKPYLKIVDEAKHNQMIKFNGFLPLGKVS